MSKASDQTIAILNTLIQATRDGAQGFRTAADGIHNNDLKGLFRCYAEQRARFTQELEDEVRRLGGDPSQHGSFAATVRRGWMNIKVLVSGGDEGAIIAECERGEDVAKGHFQDALTADLPTDVHALLERHAAGVREAHDRLRALELVASHVEG